MKRITQIDTDTGEELGGLLVHVRPKQKSPFKELATMNLEKQETLANTLNLEQFRVYHILLGALDYENYILIPQKDIAEILNMRAPNVSRAIKALTHYQIILEGESVGRLKSYRLNPNFGWRGSVVNHRKALKAGLSVIEGGKA